MKDLPKITICGIGGTGLAMAADISFTGGEVNLFALDRSKDNINALEEHGGIDMTGLESYSGRTGFAKINKATTDPEEAIKGSKLIMVAAPATAHEVFFKALLPYLEEGQNLLFNTGYFASLRFSDLLRKKGIFDKITIADGDIGPYVVRRTSPTSCHIYRFKRKLALAPFPGNKAEDMLETVRLFFPQYRKKPNILWPNLDSGNPLFHPTMTIPIHGIFERYGACNFYREATLGGERLVKVFEEERLKVAQKLGCKVQTAMEWLRETYLYEGERISTMLSRSIHAEAHTTDELSTRLITEDIAYCYVPLSELGDVVNVPTTMTKAMIEVLGAMLSINFWDIGLKLKDLGLDGLTADEIVRYVDTGIR